MRRSMRSVRRALQLQRKGVSTHEEWRVAGDLQYNHRGAAAVQK